MGTKTTEKKDEVIATITIQKKIKNSDIDDLICSALEGGINYWCRKMRVMNKDYKGGEFGSEVVSRGGTIELQDDDSGEWHLLDLDKFLKGLKLMFDNHPDFDIENHDAGDADCVIQYAIFGELVYS